MVGGPHIALSLKQYFIETTQLSFFSSHTNAAGKEDIKVVKTEARTMVLPRYAVLLSRYKSLLPSGLLVCTNTYHLYVQSGELNVSNYIGGLDGSNHQDTTRVTNNMKRQINDIYE